MAKTMPLTRGLVTTVDDEDYVWLTQWKWSAQTKRRYAYRTAPVDGKQHSVYMHRAILEHHGADLAGLETDHIDGDGLNNIRGNLRTATRAENARNCVERPSASGYRGVYANENRWQARIKVLGRLLHIGLFGSRIEAARARDIAALKYHGVFARLNFPAPVAAEEAADA